MINFSLSSSIGSISGEYEYTEENIESLAQERDELGDEVRRLATEYDILKRQVQSRDLVIKERKRILTKKLKEIRRQLIDSQHLDTKNREVKTTYDSMSAKVHSLKIQLDNKYKEIAETTAKLSEPLPSCDLLIHRISLLQSSIAQRKKYLIRVSKQPEKLNNQLTMLEKAELELKESKESLQAKATAIEERRLAKLHIMAEPIDSLEYEESLVREFDSDVEQLEARFNRMNEAESRAFNDFFETDTLFSMNRKRRIVLNSKREAIERQRLLLEKKDPEYEVIKARKAHHVAESVETQDIHTYLNEISDKLAKRQLEIESKEAEIDRICKENNIIRKNTMDQWTEKTKIIERLKQQIRENDDLIARISEMSEAVDNDRDSLGSLHFQVAQVKRRIENLTRDKSRNQKSNSVIQSLRNRIAEKQDKISEKETELSQRRSELVSLTDSIRVLEEEAKVQDEASQKMDDSVKEVIEALEEASKAARLEKNRLNEILQAIPAEQSDQFRMTQELIYETE